MAALALQDPLTLSKTLLTLLNVQTSVHFRERIPSASSLILVSNHRSILDAPLLINSLQRQVHFACHRYMGQVPGLRDMVRAFGCLPLDTPAHKGPTFFRQAIDLLQQQEAVGIFPEGAEPMVQRTGPHNLSDFHRGFAHLALRAPVEELAILPVAIASTDEINQAGFPIKLLSLFDPSEPLFQQEGWHPFVFYHEVRLLIGHPVRVTDRLREHYRGKQAGQLATEVTQCCQEEIATLLRQGAY